MGQPGTSIGNLYTAPTSSGQYAIIRTITLANTTDTACWVSLSRETSSSGNTAAKRLFDKLAVPSVDSASHGLIVVTGNWIVPEDEFITYIAQAPTAVTVSLDGVEVT